MHSITAAALLLGAAAAEKATIFARQDFSPTGSSPAGEYFEQVCLPSTEGQLPDFNIPCFGIGAISYQCAYGSTAFTNSLNDTAQESNPVNDNEPLNATTPAAQQVCFCQSQWFSMLEGCISCANKHGIPEAVPQVSGSALSSFSSSYCAASATPSQGLDQAFYSAFRGAISSARYQSASTTASDSIGNRTEVSLYYTAAVSNAYLVSQAGPSGSMASATASQSARTSNGQIVATAAVSGTASTSQSSGLAAMITPCVDKYAMAGVIGLAGAVAML